MAQEDIAALERQVEDHPADVEARTELALAYSDDGRLEEAAEQLRAALKQEPDNLDILLGLASLEHVLGDDEAVEKHVQKALDMAPDNADVYRLIYQTSEQPEQRVDRLVGGARYLELRPDAPDGDDLRDDLVRLLQESAATYEAQADAAEPDAPADGLAELLMVMPYLRKGLPAEVIGRLEVELHRLRARLAAKFALEELPADEIAAGRQRQKGQESLAQALESLTALDHLGALDEEAAELRQRLVARRDEAEAALARLGLDSTTEAVFELLDQGRAALDNQQPELASSRFQEALLALGELGDDRSPPLARPAALAYDGLAESLVAAALAEPDERDEQLALAREAADEARGRDPDLPQPYRAALEAAPALEESDPAQADGEEPGQSHDPPNPATSDGEEDAGEVARPDETDDPSATEQPEPEAPAAESDEAAPPAAEQPEPEAPAAETDEAAPPAAEQPEPEAPAAESGRDPSPAELLDEAEAALDENDLQRAEGLFEQALTAAENRGGQARALAGLGSVALARGQIEAAIESAQEAVGTDRGCLQAHLLRGRIALDQEEWAKALEAYQFAEAAAPDDPRVHRGLGVALTELERWDDALPSLEKAIAAAPQDPWLCFKLGEAFMGAGNKPHGLVCFEEALNLGLSDPQAGEVRIFLDQETRRQEMRAQKQAASETAPGAEPELADGGAAPERDAMLREKVLQRSVGGMEYNPLQHKKCPVCRHINEKSVSACARCGHDFGFVEQKRSGRGGPCFIATAALSADAPEVTALQAYRESALRPRPLGRAFIRVYDAASPPVARFIAPRPALRRLVRRLIEPLAARAERWLAARPRPEE